MCELFAMSARHPPAVQLSPEAFSRILKQGWTEIGFWEKAANVVRWRCPIADHASRIEGTAFLVPFRFSAKEKFEQFKL